MIAGLFQIVLGVLRAGVVTSFVPSTVIRGMLTAIGLMLVLKQVPHAVGYDHEAFDSDEFFVEGGGNTFTVLGHALSALDAGAVIISVAAALILFVHRKTAWKKIAWLPAPLVVVVVGTVIAAAYRTVAPDLTLGARHMVDVPLDAVGALSLPTLAPFREGSTWTLGLVLGIVATLESLLSLGAVDRLDPDKRHSDPNRELLAQGTANAVSGFLGGMPVTAVIVRSSANVNAGARTSLSAFLHGVLLLGSVLLMAPLLRQIPLAALATILVVTGIDLASPRAFVAMWKRGMRIFVPYFVTIVAILFTDLLIGILVGLAVGLAFTLRESMRHFLLVVDTAGVRTISFSKDAYFFHKAQVLQALHEAPEGTKKIVVDKARADFIAEDVREALADFEALAVARGIILELKGVPRASLMPGAH
jgi:MFS superfamily sulfate permease-like transporter